MNRLELARTKLLARGLAVLTTTLNAAWLGETEAERNAGWLGLMTEQLDRAAEELVAILHGPKEEAEK